jgi:hypothetical protein
MSQARPSKRLLIIKGKSYFIGGNGVSIWPAQPIDEEYDLSDLDESKFNEIKKESVKKIKKDYSHRKLK